MVLVAWSAGCAATAPPQAAEERYAALMNSDALIAGLPTDVGWERGTEILTYALSDGGVRRWYRLDARTAVAAPAGNGAEPVIKARVVRSVFPATGAPLREIPSPDGAWHLTLQQFNLALRPSAGEDLVPLTFSGQRNFAYTTKAAAWSPDGKMLAALKVDEREVHKVPVVRWLSGAEAVDYSPYPQARGAFAQPVLSIVDVVRRRSVDVATGSDDHFLTIAGFRPDGSELLVLRMTRDHRRTDLLAVNPQTGASRRILSEHSPTWLYGSEDVFAQARFFYPLADGRFIWLSERDGWNHLYLYRRDGQLIRRLTRGEGAAIRVEHVDERSGRVFYTARPDPSRPYDVHLLRVDLRGGRVTRLTQESGTHEIQFAPTGMFYVDLHSSLERPPRLELRRSSGALVSVLAQADIAALRASGWRAPQEVTFLAADGRTNLRGVLYLPAAFEPDRQYPLLQYIYAGAFRSVAPNTFRPADERVRFLQAMTQLGFAGLVVDARGTPGRSKAFQDVAHDSFGDHENADHAAALRQLVDGGFVDQTRVGLFGISFGGYFAIRGLLRYPHLYRAGAALAPAEIDPDVLGAAVEPFLGSPVNNARRYADASNTQLAGRLEGDLLIAVGTSDINTPLSQTFKIVQALQRAGRDCRLVVVPEANHVFRHADGGTSMPYVFEQVRRHFVRALKP